VVSVCLSVLSHCRNQFAIGTVEQREKEACQVGHIQREMKKRQDSHKWVGVKSVGGLFLNLNMSNIKLNSQLQI